MTDTTTPSGEDESDLDGALRILRSMAEGDAGPLDMDEIPLWIAAPLLAELDSRNHAAGDMAHRDDLARDVARLWPAFQRTRMNNPEATAESIKVWDELMAAFARLAAAYGEKP